MSCGLAVLQSFSNTDNILIINHMPLLPTAYCLLPAASLPVILLLRRFIGILLTANLESQLFFSL